MIKYTNIDEAINYYSLFSRYYYYHNYYCVDGYSEGKKYYGQNEDRDKVYTIKDIAQIDSGYIKDVFLQYERIVFSESDFQILKNITRGQKEENVKREIQEIYYGVYHEPYLYDFNDNVLEVINRKRISYLENEGKCTSRKIDDYRHVGFYSPAADGEYDVDIMFGEPPLLDKRSITVGVVRILSAYCKIEKKFNSFGHIHLGWDYSEWNQNSKQSKCDYKAIESCAIITFEKRYSSYRNIESHNISFNTLENLTSKIELINQYIKNGFPIEMIDFDFRVPSFYLSKCNEHSFEYHSCSNLKDKADKNDLWDAAETIKLSVQDFVDVGNGRTHDYAWDEETITIEKADLYIFCLVYMYYYKRLKDKNKEYFDYPSTSNCASHYPGIEVNYKSDTSQGELIITNYGEFGHGFYTSRNGEKKTLETEDYRSLIRFLIINYDSDLRILINMMRSNDIKKITTIIEKHVPIKY